MKKIFLLFMFLILVPSKVYGYCSSEEKVRLNNIAKNLDLTYDYYYVDNKVRFSITITNLHPDIYVFDNEHFKKIYYDSKRSNPKEITIDNFISGASYKFIVYGNTENCKDELIMTQYKTVPAYNGYSTDPLCVGIEEYDLCKKWKSAPITYEEFVKLITKYKEEKVIEEIPIEDDDKGFNYYIRIIADFISLYYGYYIAAMVLIIVLVFLLRQKYSFKLE